jgi:hypothetical protein
MDVSGQLHVPAALLPEKEHTLPIEIGAGRASAVLDTVAKRKGILPLPGIESRSSS